MKIGAVNDYNNDICDEIRLIASEGFDFVDLTLEPISGNRLDAAGVKEALDETGLEVIGHTSPFFPVIFPLKSVREASMEELTKYVDFFSGLDIKLMNIHPSLNGTLMVEKDIIRYNREFIAKLNDICLKKGITLMVETVAKPLNTPEVFNNLLDGMDNIKVHLDVGHCNINSDRNLVEEFFAAFGDRIAHIHFSDNFGNSDDHLPLGCGSIDWKKTADILKEYGYDKTITLEVFTQNRKYLLLSKKFLEDILNQ